MPESIAKVNLADELARFDETWSPRIVGELNGQHVKIVKVSGRFEWHHHEIEDELFLVLSGRLVIELPDGEIGLEPGELVIVPRGVEHCPRADEEAHLLLFEPVGTVNTGNLRNERTVEDPKRI